MSQDRIECFLIHPTGLGVRSLRRYVGPRCGDGPKAGFHSASVVLGEEPFPGEWNGESRYPTPEEVSDPRWPDRCGRCNLAFGGSDTCQVNVDRLWTRIETGDRFRLDDAPPGAMYFAPWYADSGVGPDGKHLVVVTPAGHWLVDQSHHKWQRIGAPPKVTITPSILFHGDTPYHAFLTDGVLIPC